MAASARRLSLQARISLAPLLARSMAVALPMPVFAPGEEGQNHGGDIFISHARADAS